MLGRMPITLLVLVFLGCADNEGIPVVDGGPSDAATADAAPPAEDAGTGLDASAGPPPSCDLAPFATTFAAGYPGDRPMDPDDFGAVGPAGPFGFAYRAASGTAVGSPSRLEVLLVSAEGVPSDVARLDAALLPGERLRRARLVPAAGGLFVAWTRATLDEAGALTGADVMHAGVADDGVILRAADVLYEEAVDPLLASALPDDIWVLRTDLTFLGSGVGLSPRVQHLDGVGDPVGPAVGLNDTTLPVTATDLSLSPTASGLGLAYRVPPSTAHVISLTQVPGLRGSARSLVGVPHIDGFVGGDDHQAMVFTETVGGNERVGLVVLDGGGNERARMLIEERPGDMEAHAAVVRAWPGFVVVWQAGHGEDAVLRGAGIEVDGTVRVPPEDLVSVPHMVGDLFAATDGEVVTVGYRTAPTIAAPALGLARACVPGATGP